jgi:hypothetical protein
MYEVFQYASANKIELESDYPYTAMDGTCAAKGGVVLDKSRQR